MAKAPPPRPMIGINMDYVAPGRLTGAQLRLHAGYVEAIYKSGGIPMIISHVLKDRDLTDMVDQMDGFVLTSGQFDLDPKKLGMDPHPQVQVMPQKREEFDRTLCQMIVERKKPILAVGLGMLELNSICGGTQFLHLPEDMPKSLPHKDVTGGPHRHAVNLIPNTMLDRIYGGGEILVNSYHHQAVNQVPSGFRVNATALDGVIEGMESTDPRWYCLGIQWHPHSETASALDMQIFESLIAAASKGSIGLSLAA